MLISAFILAAEKSALIRKYKSCRRFPRSLSKLKYFREKLILMFNMNAKQMEKMMKQMGIKQEQIDAEEVIIKTAGGEIVISSPQVVKVNVGGQETFQISGEIAEREKSTEPAEPKEKFSEEDAKLVAQQSGASLEDARAALEETGDIAGAIMKLKK